MSTTPRGHIMGTQHEAPDAPNNDGEKLGRRQSGAVWLQPGAPAHAPAGDVGLAPQENDGILLQWPPAQL